MLAWGEGLCAFFYEIYERERGRNGEEEKREAVQKLHLLSYAHMPHTGPGLKDGELDMLMLGLLSAERSATAAGGYACRYIGCASQGERIQDNYLRSTLSSFEPLTRILLIIDASTDHRLIVSPSALVPRYPTHFKPACQRLIMGVFASAA